MPYGRFVSVSDRKCFNSDVKGDLAKDSLYKKNNIVARYVLDFDKISQIASHCPSLSHQSVYLRYW